MGSVGKSWLELGRIGAIYSEVPKIDSAVRIQQGFLQGPCVSTSRGSLNGAGAGPFVPPAAIDPVTYIRSNSAAAFLGSDVQSRPDLRIMTGVFVEKVVLDQQHQRVIAGSVRFMKN